MATEKNAGLKRGELDGRNISQKLSGDHTANPTNLFRGKKTEGEGGGVPSWGKERTYTTRGTKGGE